MDNSFFHSQIGTIFKRRLSELVSLEDKMIVQTSDFHFQRRRYLIFVLIVLSASSVFLFLNGCRGVPFYNKSTVDSLMYSRDGIAALERQDYSLAEEKLQNAVKANPKDADAQRYYAESLWHQGKKNESLKILFAATEIPSTKESEWALHRSLAEKLLEQQEAETALDSIEKMLLLSSKEPAGWELRGHAHAQLGKYQTALADFQRALHFSPGNRELLKNIAELQWDSGQPDRSLAAWQQLGRLYPSHLEPLEIVCGKAQSYQALGRFTNASEQYAKAIRLAPDRTDLYCALAETCYQAGNIDQAVEIVSYAQRLSPVNPQSQHLFQQLRQIQLARQSDAQNDLNRY